MLAFPDRRRVDVVCLGKFEEKLKCLNSGRSRKLTLKDVSTNYIKTRTNKAFFIHSFKSISELYKNIDYSIVIFDVRDSRYARPALALLASASIGRVGIFVPSLAGLEALLLAALLLILPPLALTTCCEPSAPSAAAAPAEVTSPVGADGSDFLKVPYYSKAINAIM